MDTSLKEATHKHAKAATKKFDVFLRRHYPLFSSINELDEGHLTQELIGRFATFLVEDSSIGFSASTTYLSSVKRQIEDTLQTDFFQKNKSWYSRLRATLRATYLHKADADGKSLQEKAPLMSLNDLRALGRKLFAQGTPKAMKDRALLNWQWSLVGRSSDVSSLTFQELQWMDNFLLVRVTPKKTSQQHSVSLFAAALLWEIDPIHSFAVQLVCDPFSPSRRVFSRLGEDKRDNVSAYINRFLQTLTT